MKEKQLNEIQNLRNKSQPVKRKTGGSTFKNPQDSNYKAWELIELSGCKGMKEGGAMVSDLHCNFLINTGHASAFELEENIILPESILPPPNSTNLIIESEETDFPDPDSPTKQTVSPGKIENDKSLTPVTLPVLVWKLTFKLFTSRMGDFFKLAFFIYNLIVLFIKLHK